MSTTMSNNHETSESQRVSAGAAVLWASAMVLLGLILHQAGSRPWGNSAYADVASAKGLTVSTIAVSQDEDVVAVLDQQSEVLYVYGVDQGRSVELYQLQNLPDLFNQGRGAAAGQRTGAGR